MEVTIGARGGWWTAVAAARDSGDTLTVRLMA